MAGIVGKIRRRYVVFGEGFDVARHLVRNDELPGQIVITNSTKK